MFKSFISVILTVVMILTSVNMSMLGPAYAEDELEASSINNDDVKRSIDIVIRSVDDLKEIMNQEEQSTLAGIFGAFASGITVLGAINTSVTFMRLVGLISDPTSNALANIQRQLDQIIDKLAIMDQKLDAISSELSKMQAVDEVNMRGLKAIQYMSEWQKFDHDYMEEEMDELMRRYDTMMRDRIKAWIEYNGGAGRQTEDGEVNTNRIVLWYKGANPLDPNGKYEFRPTSANNIEPETDRPSRPEPYTIYANDDDYNPRYDKFMILDETFLPVKGDVIWNIDDYRSNLKEYFIERLNDLRDENGNIKEEYTSHIKEDKMNIPQWTKQDIDTYAEDIVNSIIYRISYTMVNESADFSTTLYKQFGEYCKHLVSAQQGVDALLKAKYLTSTFEYEAADDIKAFLDEMILRTGVYSMFAMDVLGMSEFIRNDEKVSTAETMCNTINSLKDIKDNSLTGDPGYCYVTNSVLNYAEVTLSGSVDIKYYIRGAVSGYQSYNQAVLSRSFSSDEDIGDSPVFVGETNALTIAYMLRRSGQVMDHNYLNEKFSETNRPEHDGMIISMTGEQTMNIDTGCLMKSHKTIGGYFYGDPTVTLNHLPKKAETEYLVSRKMYSGTTLDGAALSMQRSRPLIGTAAYGENHWNWEVDEAALLGGPCDNKTFQDKYWEVLIDDGIVTNTYRAYYTNSVKYNCLLQVDKNYLGATEGPSPLDDLKKLTDDISERAEARGALKEAIASAEKFTKVSGWTAANLSKFKSVIADAKEALDNNDLTNNELEIETQYLTDAQDYFRTLLRKPQKMKVSAKPKTLKARALKKSKKVIKAITVKNPKGKVRYKKIKVTKARFKKYFTVNSKTGKITVRKGLKKGTYKVKVKIRAAGNSKYMPITKYATVKIRVK